jgi:hypothetical protein
MGEFTEAICTSCLYVERELTFGLGFDIYFEASHCPRCRRVVAAERIEDAPLHCPRCNGPVEPWGSFSDPGPYPKCGEVMRADMVGIWD